jgi:hypothetical protein
MRNDRRRAGMLSAAHYRVLNHTSGHKVGVASTYNRRLRQKREGLERWADELARIVGP